MHPMIGNEWFNIIIITSNHMFINEIWDEFTESVFETFEIS